MYDNDNMINQEPMMLQPESEEPVQVSVEASMPVFVQEPIQNGKAKKQKQKKEKTQKKSRFFPKLLVAVSLGLFFGIFAGIGFYGIQQATEHLNPKEVPVVEPVKPLYEKQQNVVKGQDGKQEIPVQVPQSGTTAVYTGTSNNVSDIVVNVMPAMVSIINNYTQVTSFWGQTYKEELSASGSGIIVSQNDEELLIVSNWHVVADADELLVTLIDDTQVEAYIKGMDSDMDLAVIAIRLEDLSAETLAAINVATLGNSDELILGEQVIAIGNALGYGQSVTVGYVSALDREIEIEDGSLRSFIQTDAAINPGNSGGALLNARGEVIGINSNKIGGTSIEGMGYAIPITAASPIIADLMERQTRTKVDAENMGYMGISYQDVTDEVSQMYGMPRGVYVVSVLEDTGAEAAGMIMGDVIVDFDGNKITCYEDLYAVLQYYSAGDTAEVTVKRPVEGVYKEVELQLTLGERPEEEVIDR